MFLTQSLYSNTMRKLFSQMLNFLGKTTQQSTNKWQQSEISIQSDNSKSKAPLWSRTRLKVFHSTIHTHIYTSKADHHDLTEIKLDQVTLKHKFQAAQSHLGKLEAKCIRNTIVRHRTKRSQSKTRQFL